MNKSFVLFISLSGAVHACEQRINLLENALAPASPKALVTLFADAVKQRNGAVQYMLFCPALQKKYLKMFQELNWVTGTSSPSFADYKLSGGTANQFQISFSMSLQGKPAGTTLDTLQIIPVESGENPARRWCIDKYKRRD